MKIAHVCLCGPFNPDWNYQDNLLPRQNKADGHDVFIVATCYVNDKKSNGFVKVAPCFFMDSCGVECFRIAGATWFPKKIQEKVRYHPELFKILCEKKPDVVFVHGLPSLDIFAVAKYKKRNPSVRVFADSHAAFDNSGLNWFSKYILHGFYNRLLVKIQKKYFDKIFYIAAECKTFLEQAFGLEEKRDRLEFLTLGGIIPDARAYSENRKVIREKFGLGDGDVVFLHTGKMNNLKKSLETLRLFAELKTPKLWIAGIFSTDIKSEAEKIISESPNIEYLGWLSGDELIKYMCAADVLHQLGGQSATYQQAICCSMSVILGDYKNHEFLISNGNGFIARNAEDSKSKIKELVGNPQMLADMKKRALEFAEKSLSYSAIAKRMY